MEKHILVMGDHALKMLLVGLIVMTSTARVHSELVPITYLNNSAVTKGAVCLDGSPASYYHSPGSGDGAANWVVYLEGGGWCAYGVCNDWISKKSGYHRTSPARFGDILDSDQTKNPDFYNWNRVFVSYCDGSSFSGDVEFDPQYKNITRRGARIFSAVMEDLLAKGMKNAKNALLTGSSAGGLATILNCDRFAALIPSAGRVKCIADAGFFIRGKSNLPADEKRAAVYDSVIQFHNMTNFLPASCTSKMLPSQCMFPENLVNNIKTPLFLLQSTMDFYQMKTGLTLDISYNDTWTQCTETLQNCTEYQIGLFKELRSVFLKTVEGLGKPPPSRGMYVHSCVSHGHFLSFLGLNISPIPGFHETVRSAIGDWYYDRKSIQVVDTRANVEPALCTLST